MSRKKNTLNNFSGLVYSTDPGYKLPGDEPEEAITLPAAEQRLRIRLDTKHRAGKAVTLIEGFVGTDADIEDLGKQLKSFCGTGGSVKDSEIIVQGDNREKVLQWLLKKGYKLAKKQ